MNLLFSTIAQTRLRLFTRLIAIVIALLPLHASADAIVTTRADGIRPLASPIYEFGGTEADLRATWAAKIADLAP